MHLSAELKNKQKRITVIANSQIGNMYFILFLLPDLKAVNI